VTFLVPKNNYFLHIISLVDLGQFRLEMLCCERRSLRITTRRRTEHGWKASAFQHHFAVDSFDRWTCIDGEGSGRFVDIIYVGNYLQIK
jgi:hypothetical protein